MMFNNDKQRQRYKNKIKVEMNKVDQRRRTFFLAK